MRNVLNNTEHLFVVLRPVSVKDKDRKRDDRNVKRNKENGTKEFNDLLAKQLNSLT